MNAGTAWAQAMGRGNGKAGQGEEDQGQEKEERAGGGGTTMDIGGRHASCFRLWGVERARDCVSGLVYAEDGDEAYWHGGQLLG